METILLTSESIVMSMYRFFEKDYQSRRDVGFWRNIRHPYNIEVMAIQKLNKVC